MQGITKKRLEELQQEWLEKYGISASTTIDALIDECEELDPWRQIKESPVDTKERLFVTKSGKQRVDRFHPSQHATDSTDLRWQERPVDRYTHFKELSEAPEK